MTRNYELMLRSELDATCILIERAGSTAIVVAVISSPSTEPEGTRDAILCRAVSAVTNRSDAEAFVHGLRREADRIEKLIGGLTTEAVKR